MQMDSSSDITTIDLTPSTSDTQTSSSNNDKSSCTVKTKIGRHGLEQYYDDFKEYTAGDMKGKTSAICTLCKDIVWHVKASTSNYSRHLQRKHKAEYELWSQNASFKEKNENKFKQVSLEDSLSSSPYTSKYGPSHPRQVELTKMIFQNLIVGLDLPLSITEKPAFIQAMKTVDPKFRVPSRRSITSDYLPKLHEQITKRLKNVCSSTDFLSLTFDGWTDRRMRAFYAVTMHYIDRMGQLKAHLLAFNPLSGSHTGENLFNEYDRVSTAFSIGNKVVRLITDNASNNLSAFGELVIPGFESYFITDDDIAESDDDDLNEINLNMSEGHRPDDDEVESELDKREELLRLPCFIHTLQLVVKDGLDESGCTRSAMAKVAEIAKLSHKTVITRWNSQFITVSKILDISNVFLNDMLTEQKKGELVLSMKDLAILREFISILTLFVEATTRTQAEQCVSISLVAPSILGIYYDLENELKLCKYTSSLCNALINSLKERFGGLLLNLEIPVDGHIKRRSTFELFSDDIFLISSFLDGQFRLRWILQSALSQDIKNRLCDKIKHIVAQAAFQIHDSAINAQGATDAQTDTVSTAVDNSLTPKRKSLFGYCEASHVLPKKMRINIMDEISEEMMLFLKDQRYETDLIFVKKNHFPHLHRLALKVLCIPATSAPAERIFSQSGLLMRPHRSRLSKDMLSKLTFIKCNLDLLN
ncbi:unnamed protein product [Rotaria sp. Silwood2]|nr:unnamed protein product [Rotaria sp. Silwood2]CAF4035573.1 unnamed protein product [Rotaria sp. Silwood2]CAF4594532.1 unnamed protein product [Rotaria sp. Silwood2]